MSSRFIGRFPDSPEVRKICIDRLDKTVDKMNLDARHMPDFDWDPHGIALREAADYLSEIRKQLQESL